jgi:hypothetical protein
MSKKKPAIKISVEPIIDQQQEPAEEFPIRQVDEVQPEPVVQAESTSVIETAPAVEPVPAPVEVTTKPEPPSKPKPLTMASLHSELDALRQVFDQQGLLIKQLMETPIRQRKPPVSNGKVQIRDKQTVKIYKSKNSAYQTMLKAGELKDLVEKGIFGDNPYKNSFGCYALFRAYPDRFEEIREQEQSV